MCTAATFLGVAVVLLGCAGKEQPELRILSPTEGEEITVYVEFVVFCLHDLTHVSIRWCFCRYDPRSMLRSSLSFKVECEVFQLPVRLSQVVLLQSFMTLSFGSNMMILVWPLT